MKPTIKEIPIEEADRICMDVQLWWKDIYDGWKKDYLPSIYREIGAKPSDWNLEYGIELCENKPEYTPDG